MVIDCNALYTYSSVEAAIFAAAAAAAAAAASVDYIIQYIAHLGGLTLILLACTE